MNLSDGGICRINMARTSSIVVEGGLAARLLPPEQRGRTKSEVCLSKPAAKMVLKKLLESL